jgi:UDP-4-amino-4-deoxy-L-arabinose formyltransferase/UDP-glucuronic acid dehydrogenase (UDP-4-keto-hexauronic acid decarboxylating)
MNIILCGYNWAGCKALDNLISKGHNVFVYTHDNPNHVISLVDLCKRKEVPYSLEKIKINNLPFQPDIICSIYYQFIIDSSVIDVVRGKIFNLHPSLLPEYKGCSSLVWALLNGESFTGFTYHYITRQIDSGNILHQQKIKIEDFDTGLSLYYKAMFIALEYFNEVLEKVILGEEGVKQLDNSESLYYRRGAPYQCQLNNDWDIDKKERFVRALNFPPLPPAELNGENIWTYSQLEKFLNN